MYFSLSLPFPWVKCVFIFFSKLNSPVTVALLPPWCLSSDTTPSLILSPSTSFFPSAKIYAQFSISSNIFSWHYFLIKLFLSFPCWNRSLHLLTFLLKLLWANRNFNFKGKWSLIRSHSNWFLCNIWYCSLYNTYVETLFCFQGITICLLFCHPLYLSLVSLPLSIFKYWCFLLSILFRTFFGGGKFGKLSSGHRTGKGQFSFQSQRKAMPKNAQTTAQLHSSHTLVN